MNKGGINELRKMFEKNVKKVEAKEKEKQKAKEKEEKQKAKQKEKRRRYFRIGFKRYK